MHIAPDMDLTHLAVIMGTAADRRDAQIMRELLIATRWAGGDTEDVPHNEWWSLLDAVAQQTWRFYA